MNYIASKIRKPPCARVGRQFPLLLLDRRSPCGVILRLSDEDSLRTSTARNAKRNIWPRCSSHRFFSLAAFQLRICASIDSLAAPAYTHVSFLQAREAGKAVQIG